MPHIYLKDFKSNISAIATAVLAEAEAYAIRYGLEKAQEIVEDLLNQCPPPSVLNSINKKLTDIKKVKLGIEKKLVLVEEQAARLDKPILVTKASIEVLSHFPLPSSVPPGVGIPVGVLNTYGNALEFLRGMVNALEDDKVGIQSVVEIAKNGFAPIDIQITRIEALLNRCAENPNLTEEERKAILDGALINPVTDTNVDYKAKNGEVYKLSIEEDKENTFQVKKRRAVAKDKNGVNILNGPFSYAGSTEILIEEIKFRLDNQLP